MKTNKLAAVIRRIVREEVQKGSQKFNNRAKQQKQSESSNTLSLTEALSQTETESYPTAKTFNSVDARAGFASMQGDFGTPQTPTAFEGHSGRIVDASKVDPSVAKAMTRDYSDLVKRFKK